MQSILDFSHYIHIIRKVYYKVNAQNSMLAVFYSSEND